MKVRFWGCRGSIPRSRPDMMRYGGNTPCVQVLSDGGTLVILDLGTGVQDLGEELLAGASARAGAMMITHTHWDHIQGFPFFAPLFVAGNRWDIYGPRGLGASLRDTLAGQMQYQYFPITLEAMAAEVQYHDLVEGTIGLGDLEVRTQYLNHPALTLGYRLEGDGVSVVYATDHEPHDRRLAVEGYRPGSEADDRHVEFVRGADLLIHDSQYTAEEYPAKEGWGHSTIEYAVDVALAGDVRQLALFHHDPMRDDEAVDRVLDMARKRVREAGGALEVIAAADRTMVEPQPSQGAVARQLATGTSARYTPALEDELVLLALSDSAAAVDFSRALRDDSIDVLVADDGQDALKMASAKHPSLLLVARNLPDGDAFEVCRRVREDVDWGNDVPFIVVTPGRSDVDAQAGRRAGVTDWLVEPYSNAYARTRIRAWLLRSACRWQCPPIPQDEETRLAALRATGLLDTPPEERFDRITRIAAQLFDVPIAAVTLIDQDRQWFKSRQGIDADQTPRDQAFCAYTIHHDEVMVVPDALQDDRFADNPMVVNKPYVRFYAGCPIALGDGSRIGSLCLVDHRPRDLDEKQISLLRDLAEMVEKEISQAAASGAA